ncbi:MAG: hypothetical protein Q4E67_06300, partial [Planctomycetia bacterium]|nr:hypothetical protein [Planctomycetia bacterium]
ETEKKDAWLMINEIMIHGGLSPRLGPCGVFAGRSIATGGTSYFHWNYYPLATQRFKGWGWKILTEFSAEGGFFTFVVVLQ